jgi:hypothetical protein
MHKSLIVSVLFTHRAPTNSLSLEHQGKDPDFPSLKRRGRGDFRNHRGFHISEKSPLISLKV